MKIKISEIKQVICELLADPVSSQVFSDWLLEQGVTPAKFNTPEWVDQIVKFRSAGDSLGSSVALGAWQEVSSASAIFKSKEFLAQDDEVFQAMMIVTNLVLDEVLSKHEAEEVPVEILGLSHQELAISARDIFQGIQAVAAVGGSAQGMRRQASVIVDAFEEYDPSLHIAHLFEYLRWMCEAVEDPTMLRLRSSRFLEKLRYLEFNLEAPEVAKRIIEAVPDPCSIGVVSEAIRKRDGKWVLYTRNKGRNGKRRRLGTHDRKEDAQRQERAIRAKGKP